MVDIDGSTAVDISETALSRAGGCAGDGRHDTQMPQTAVRIAMLTCCAVTGTNSILRSLKWARPSQRERHAHSASR